MSTRLLRVVLTGLLCPAFAVAEPFMNGFDLAGSTVPIEEIKKGGPPRDGIPAVHDPEFAPATAADMDANERVIGVSSDGFAKAYPVRVLNWHEIVNDRIGARDILVSYCPLCGTGMVFDAVRNSQTMKFGVSGLLYNSDILLYDHGTESLWSQILAHAIGGPLRGTELTLLAASNTTWRDWLHRHPDTLVMTTNTGYARDYTRSPYLRYAKRSRLYFPVSNVNRKYHNKEMVLGVTVGGAAKAYPFKELEAHEESRFEDKIGDKGIVIEWSAKEQTARVLDAHNREIPSVLAYWFAWYAFHPDTEVFE